MWRTLLNVCISLTCLLAGVLLTSGSGLGQNSDGETVFWSKVERLGKDLNSFWDRELNEAANLILLKQDELLGIALTDVDRDGDVYQRCEIIPKADLKTRTVRFNRRELIGLSFANSYPVLAYLVGSEVASTPQDIDRFVRETARPFFRQLINDCIEAKAARVTYRWDDLRAISIYKDVGSRIIQRDVQLVARRSGQSFKDRNLDDFMAVIPLSFVLLHEAAHIVFSEEGLSLVEIEGRADMFAVDTFHGTHVPATLGIPFLQMFGFRMKEGEMNCRISKIAAADRSGPDWSIEMGRFEIARVEALRSYYERTYRDDCL